MDVVGGSECVDEADAKDKIVWRRQQPLARGSHPLGPIDAETIFVRVVDRHELDDLLESAAVARRLFIGQLSIARTVGGPES